MSGEVIADRIYGEFTVSDPLAIDLIQTPSMQRLREVAQMGPYRYAFPEIDTTRFEHCLGVYYLLDHFGASREEQIAGLLHDASHGVFSHVIDHLKGTALNQEWQDSLHGRFIEQSEIPATLQKHSVSLEAVANHTKWSLLDQPLPDICADRLDYGLRDSFVCKVMKKDEVINVLNNLQAVEGKLIFTDMQVARFYAEKSIIMARDWWSSAVWGTLQFNRMAEALRIGLEQGIIAEEDLMTTDNQVWSKLESSGRPDILRELQRVRNIRTLSFVITDNPTDIHFQGKYRGVDPQILVNSRLVRISDLFPELKDLGDKVKMDTEREKYIKILE